MIYAPKTFELPAIDGISTQSIEEHIGLYNGYVKNFNAIEAAIVEYMQDSAKHAHALSELTRRKSFEFDGMRLHEIYFEQFTGKRMNPTDNSVLGHAIAGQYGTIEMMIEQMTAVALMRGPGWSILYWDPEGGRFHIGFAGEQHQGHFASLPIVIALDVWEHAFLLDYGAQGKAKYVAAFFKAINWGVLEERFAPVQA
jgi:Fe-Mn family superoxide dismutase